MRLLEGAVACLPVSLIVGTAALAGGVAVSVLREACMYAVAGESVRGWGRGGACDRVPRWAMLGDLEGGVEKEGE